MYASFGSLILTLTNTTGTMVNYFTSLGYPCPEHTNPADHFLDLVNTDFMPDPDERAERIDWFARSWIAAHEHHNQMARESESVYHQEPPAEHPAGFWRTTRIAIKQTTILIERNHMNYSRNVLAYGIRLGMYRECHSCFERSTSLMPLPQVGLGVLMATVWTRLPLEASKAVSPSSPRALSPSPDSLLPLQERPGLSPLLRRCLSRLHVCRGRSVPHRGAQRLRAQAAQRALWSWSIRHCSQHLQSTLLSGVRGGISINQVRVFIDLAKARMPMRPNDSYWAIGLHSGIYYFLRYFCLMFLGLYVAESQVGSNLTPIICHRVYVHKRVICSPRWCPVLYQYS
jgi:hypothetical protein